MSSAMDLSEITALPAQVPKAAIDCLGGKSETSALARTVDWAGTAIGPVEDWSQALRSTASLVLHNDCPMVLWWGPEFVQIYNDAYIPLLGQKHPRAMGQRFQDCWSEVFHILGPWVERPFSGGPASTSDDLAVPVNRRFLREEAHFRFAYSPVPDGTVASTAIGGVLATCTETTEEVYALRQILVLRELGARTAADATTVERACQIAAAVLEENAWDVPFAMLYLLDKHGARARLAASAGFKERPAAQLTCAEVDLPGPEGPDPWAIRTAVSTLQTQVISALPVSAGPLPLSPWSDAPHSAIALPLAAPGHERAYGVLICGLSPHRQLDAGYRSFFEMAAAQTVSAISNAMALEEGRRRAEALTQIDRAKTDFFSNVSHEFRTPLTLMLGPVEDASLNPDTPPRLRAQLELAHRNGLRLLKLVNSLLDFSRIEAGRLKGSYQPTDLASLTRDLASTFRSAVERAGLDYIVDCEPLAELVHVDWEMWEKIVLNLISNAFKYTLQGSIVVRVRREGEHAALEVIDSGVGIPEAQIKHVFERFHRVEGTVGRTQEGTGIGLALVQELVKLHGATITAASELGHGSTFKVLLPFGTAHLPEQRTKANVLSSTTIAANAFVEEALRWLPDSGGAALTGGARSGADPALRAAKMHPAAPDHKGRPRILLIDDNADMRAYVRDLLSSRYAVETAADGEQGLEALRRQRPDLVITDIMMPRIDGLTLLANLRADKHLKQVPVVLLSARAGEEARVDAIDAGADDYLVKPFSARELLARVNALLELTRLRRQSEERFDAYLRATSDAAYSMSPDWSELSYIRGGLQVFLPEVSEPRKNWIEQFVVPDYRPSIRTEIQRVLTTGAVFEHEHPVQRPDGSVVWVFARAVPVLNERGEIVEWFGLAVDMTERKRVEQVLRGNARWLEAQKEAFQAAVNGAQLEVSLGILAKAAREQLHKARCGFFILKDEDRRRLRHVTGMSQEYARSTDGLMIGADVPGCGLAAFTGQAVITPDVTQDSRWEGWQWLAQLGGFRACWSFPIETSIGKVVGTLAIYHEEPTGLTPRGREMAAILTHSAAIIISQHQEAEERARTAQALSQNEARLRSADRQKDEFLAMLAHELRNPLAPIGNASELLSRMLAEDARAQGVIDMIKRQVAHLIRLVDDLLDVSRITQGRIQLSRRPVDLATVVSQAIETVEPRLREKQHKLSVISTSYEPLYIDGDCARLVQCVANVLTNAAKYTDAGGEIRIQTRAEDSCAVIEVVDSGAGIPPELLPRIFDLFVQSDRTLDRSQGGLGVGLAIVKRLIDMHGGTVTAHSEGLGHGSKFEIWLPRSARPPLNSSDGLKIEGSQRRVFIVDDNVDAANSLAMLLKLQGHEAEAVYSASDALERIGAFKADVALLDIGLPEMSGYELARRLRTLSGLEGLRLVALTGYGQIEDRQRARDAGFDHHLVKPVDLGALERTLVDMSAAAGGGREA